MGRAMLNKILIQFYAEGLGSVPSLLFDQAMVEVMKIMAIRVVSSAYLKLLLFPLAILIPACASSSLAFCMMYSSFKFNKQDDNIQP